MLDRVFSREALYAKLYSAIFVGVSGVLPFPIRLSTTPLAESFSNWIFDLPETPDGSFIEPETSRTIAMFSPQTLGMPLSSREVAHRPRNGFPLLPGPDPASE